LVNPIDTDEPAKSQCWIPPVYVLTYAVTTEAAQTYQSLDRFQTPLTKRFVGGVWCMGIQISYNETMNTRNGLRVAALLVTVFAGGLFFVRLGLGDDFGSAESHRQFVRDLWIFGIGTLAGLGVLLMLRKLKR